LRKAFIYGLILGLVLLLIMVSCTSTPVVCNKPYILVGTDCCLDKDDNSICDSDEPTVNEAPKPEEVEAPAKNEPKVQEEIDSFAREFARVWEKEDFEPLYPFFSSELTDEISLEDYMYRVNISYKDFEVISVRIQKSIIESSDLAYLYFIADFGFGDDISLPAVRLDKVDAVWKIDSFHFFFDSIDTVCEDERHPDECAYDYATSFEHGGDCQYAGALYDDCLLFFGITPSMEQMAESCKAEPVNPQERQLCILNATVHGDDARCDLVDELYVSACEAYFNSEENKKFCDEYEFEASIGSKEYAIQYSWCIYGLAWGMKTDSLCDKISRGKPYTADIYVECKDRDHFR